MSSRLTAATFRTKQKRILVRLIMCYAPTNEASDEVRRVLGIYWLTTIGSAAWETTGQAPMRQELTSRKWTWIGHTLRRPNYCIARQALLWNPQGSRRRGRPRDRWRRDTDHVIQSRGLSWHQLERLSRDRGDWRDLVSSLCSELE